MSRGPVILAFSVAATAAAVAIGQSSVGATLSSAGATSGWETVTEFRGAKSQLCRVDGRAGSAAIHFRHVARDAQQPSRTIVKYSHGDAWSLANQTRWIRPGEIGRSEGGAAFSEQGVEHNTVKATVLLRNGKKHSETHRISDLPDC